MSNENAVTTTQGGAVAKVAVPAAVITQIIEARKAGFLAVNAGLDMDYVRIGTYLKINKKGNIVEARDENVSYGDTLDLVVGMGEQRWSLWGGEGTPEDGELIVAEKTEKEGREALAEWLQANPEAAERYGMDDVKLRYIAFVVPVESLAESVKNEEPPKLYLFPWATVDTYEWGAYAMKLYDGKFKHLGVPAKSGANTVVTRVTTVEKEGKGNNKFIGVTFDAVGPFNPADYGITLEEAPAQS
jgi:hypothetical protein